jgi:hypothetical protein
MVRCHIALMSRQADIIIEYCLLIKTEFMIIGSRQRLATFNNYEL